MSKKLFQIFDATFNAPSGFDSTKYGMHPCWWGGEAYMTNADRTIEMATIEDARNIAHAIRELQPLKIVRLKDGVPWWSGVLKAARPHSLVNLDFERLAHAKGGRDIIKRYLEMYRRVAPEQRIGFGFDLLASDPANISFNREDWIKPSKEKKKTITAAKTFTASLIPLIDYLNPNAYMLGEASFERDLNFIIAMAKTLRSFDRPIYPMIWGVWHPTWNPPVDGVRPRMNAMQMKGLRSVLEEHCDGAIIWGQYEENVELYEAMRTT